MIELRPALVPAEAPLMLSRPRRPVLDASVRPLVRGAVLVGLLTATLGLPAFRPLADIRPSLRRPEAARTLGPVPLGTDRVRVARLGR